MSGGKAAAGPARAFPGQHPGEDVALVFHQHPIVMRMTLIVGLVAIVVGLLPILAWPLSDILTKLGFIYVPLAVVLVFFYRWVSWYYSVYIVTNERLVEIKQKGFFNRKVTEFGLDKIQNINYHIKGLQAVIFQFGDITVQTYVGDLVMKTIYRPTAIQEQLVEIVRVANAAEAGHHPEPPPPRAD